MARTKKYPDANEFDKKVDSYFAYAKKNKKPFTVTGLCVYLGICRDTLCEYEKLEEYSDTIKSAKTQIENWIEENSLLGKTNPAVSIFNLKHNFGWKDKQEIEHTGSIGFETDFEEVIDK